MEYKWLENAIFSQAAKAPKVFLESPRIVSDEKDSIDSLSVSNLKDSGPAQMKLYFNTNVSFIFHVTNVLQSQLKTHSPMNDIAVVLLG